MRPASNRKAQRAQIFVLFALSLPVLLGFMGLGIDLGFAFVERTNLSKAVEAAALAAMRNINQGPARATAIARSAFNTNYGLGIGRDISPPVLNVVIGTDATNNSTVNVNATATINTFFLRILSGFKTLKISSNAQATRPKLIMSLVLDRSGSMTLNGGAQALPSAVDNFLTYFDNANDQVAGCQLCVARECRCTHTNELCDSNNKCSGQDGVRRGHLLAECIAGRADSD